jgi:hypothetical protein
MFSKIQEITKAWVSSYNATPNQKKLADARYDVCVQCEFYGKKRPIVGDEFCKSCGCPIQKKIFTDKTYLSEKGSCPKNYWKEVEELYWEKTIKNTKSML